MVVAVVVSFVVVVGFVFSKLSSIVLIVLNISFLFFSKLFRKLFASPMTAFEDDFFVFLDVWKAGVPSVAFTPFTPETKLR